MIYNNLLYFFIVILLLSLTGPAAAPPLAPLLAALLFLGKGGLFCLLLRRIFRSPRLRLAADYAAAERRSAILAVLFFALDLYLLDGQYYFAKLPGGAKLPVVANLAGMLLFLGYLSLAWTAARPAYARIFGRSYRPAPFILNNVRLNLPIVLPWLLLSLAADLLAASSRPEIKALLASAWGEYLLFLLSFLLLALFFPFLIVRLWRCTPLPAGEARQLIAECCRRQGVGYGEIYLWPLFEGRTLTAGVMGFVKRFRYLLVTPALLQELEPREVEAVIAHELGHVKKGHLFLYLFLFLGFLPLSQLLAYPLFSLLSASDWFYAAVRLADKEPGAALAFASTLPLFVAMILYFRYFFGFFMRNFERQADLHALAVTASSRPLVRVFEKIAWLGGNIRDLPSWHHFGLGERIAWLERCEREPGLIARHERKVYLGLGLYLLFLVTATVLAWQLPAEPLAGTAREKFVEATLQRQLRVEPNNTLWPQLLGDWQYGRQRYRAAAAAYEQALALAPGNAEALNNLAWLLLTVADRELRDPARALPLAEKAAALKPLPHILDTLALAYWLNGQGAAAVSAAQRALAQGPTPRDYYEAQLGKFSQPPPGPE